MNLSTLGTQIGSQIGTNIVKRDVAIPALYLVGAAGSLAYGTYALVSYLREEGPTTIACIAKLTAPAVVGSGLAYLGVRSLRSGGRVIPTRIASAAGLSARSGRGGSSSRRGRRSRASMR